MKDWDKQTIICSTAVASLLKIGSPARIKQLEECAKRGSHAAMLFLGEVNEGYDRKFRAFEWYALAMQFHWLNEGSLYQAANQKVKKLPIKTLNHQRKKGIQKFLSDQNHLENLKKIFEEKYKKIFLDKFNKELINLPEDKRKKEFKKIEDKSFVKILLKEFDKIGYKYFKLNHEVDVEIQKLIFFMKYIWAEDELTEAGHGYASDHRGKSLDKAKRYHIAEQLLTYAGTKEALYHLGAMYRLNRIGQDVTENKRLHKSMDYYAKSMRAEGYEAITYIYLTFCEKHHEKIRSISVKLKNRGKNIQNRGLSECMNSMKKHTSSAHSALEKAQAAWIVASLLGSKKSNDMLESLNKIMTSFKALDLVREMLFNTIQHRNTVSEGNKNRKNKKSSIISPVTGNNQPSGSSQKSELDLQTPKQTIQTHESEIHSKSKSLNSQNKRKEIREIKKDTKKESENEEIEENIVSQEIEIKTDSLKIKYRNKKIQKDFEGLFSDKGTKDVLLAIFTTKPWSLSGVGKPEKLKRNLKGLYSRRYNQNDRIVYRVEKDGTLYIHSCTGHY